MMLMLFIVTFVLALHWERQVRKERKKVVDIYRYYQAMLKNIEAELDAYHAAEIDYILERSTINKGAGNDNDRDYGPAEA